MSQWKKITSNYVILGLKHQESTNIYMGYNLSPAPYHASMGFHEQKLIEHYKGSFKLKMVNYI